MTTPTIDRPAAGQPEPMLPLADVRAEVDAATNVDAFDRWVELAIKRAEEAGDFTRFRKELRGWLGTALSGKHQDELLALPFAERSPRLDRLTAEWIAAHPGHDSFA